jgi:hypothetical protein
MTNKVPICHRLLETLVEQWITAHGLPDNIARQSQLIVAKQRVVMPERVTKNNTVASEVWCNGWNTCLDEVTRLNAEKELAALREQVPVAECTNEDSWNCKYCNKTNSCLALKDDRNFAAPVAKQVVMPERDKLECLLDEVCRTNETLPTDEPIYSIGLSEVMEVIKRLNAADQEGGQDE